MLSQEEILKNFINGNSKDAKSTYQSKQRAKIISVTSGKGGVGKTNFTVNFAIELARRGKKVLIIDADFGLSNIDVVLGITPRYDLSQVISGKRRIEEVITDGPYGVKFISGGSGVYDLISVNRDDIEVFLSELLRLEKLVDIIIFDTGAGVNRNNIQLIQASDEVVLVTTAEPPAIVDAYALTKTIVKVDKATKIRIVINRADGYAESEEIYEKFKNVAKNYLGIDVKKLGYITDDINVSKAVKAQKPFTIQFPTSIASRNLSDITKAFLNMGEQDGESEPRGIRGFIKKMFG